MPNLDSPRLTNILLIVLLIVFLLHSWTLRSALLEIESSIRFTGGRIADAMPR